MKIKNLLTLMMVLLFSITSIAQSQDPQKLDRIIKRDYQIIDGTITKISETEIEYNLPNEKLVNSLLITHIARIEFASGRVQTFDAVAQEQPSSSTAVAEPVAPSQTSTAASSENSAPAITENMIAVLPIPYIDMDNMMSSDEMSKFAQNDVYNKLISKSSNISPLTVQDLRITNSLLHKAGIDYKNIDETPITDLLAILGVDHIVAAKISYTTKETQSSQTIDGGQTKYQNNKTKDLSLSSTNTQNNKYYYYTVYFDMYKSNNKIYSQTRKPAFAIKDSWVDAMAHLLKKSPIYVK